MYINYRIVDGCRGGLTFDFVPSMHPSEGYRDYDRHGPDVFNMREEAFAFIEGMVARVVPGWWENYRHWGSSSLSREMWFEVFAQFAELRRDVKGNARLDAILHKYVPARATLPSRINFHRKALLRFLDQFESRVRKTLERYPYLIVCGV